jgi:hypothetical protein
MEFRAGCGLWTVVAFTGEAARDRWQDPVKAAFRWLADSGFGGERSRGWGRAEAPEFVEGMLPELILAQDLTTQDLTTPDLTAQGPDVFPPLQEPPQEPPPVVEPPEVPQLPDTDPEPQLPPPDPEPLPAAPATAAATATTETAAPALTAHWLLSLFSPAAGDAVEWTRGSYTLLERGGRVDSPAGSGALKKQLRMVSEGSVLYAPSAPQGAAPDVAPDGFAHPVFRAGFALSIPLPDSNWSRKGEAAN